MPVTSASRGLCLAAIVGLAGAAAAGRVRAAAPPTPAAVIEQLDRVVLDDLRARGRQLDVDPDGLYALARERIRPHFDLDHTAHMVVGPTWLAATPAARTVFVAALERYLVTSYARALLFVERDTLSVLGPAQEVGPQFAQLPVRVIMDDGAEVEADVHFRLDGGHWRIWDVRAGGISFVRQYRGDFGTEARLRGLAECSASLERIAERNEAELRERLKATGSIKKAR